MRDRGYPADDGKASMEALSVYHARSLEGYRQTLGLKTESATTEQLREALIRYRALFEDLTGLREGQEKPGRDRVAAIRDRAADTGMVATGSRDAAAEDRRTAASERDMAAEDRDMAAEDRDMAAEPRNRTADTPRPR
jgi:hypothetical protein